MRRRAVGVATTCFRVCARCHSRVAVIAYLAREHRVEITNIFYGGQDYEALFRKSPADD
jgi:plasmid stabilization system protein ParE